MLMRITDTANGTFHDKIKQEGIVGKNLTLSSRIIDLTHKEQNVYSDNAKMVSIQECPIDLIFYIYR